MLFRIALIPFSYAIMQCLFAIMANFIRQEISFGKKFHSTRNFIWQKISFGIKIHSVRNFIRQEISFGRKFHSARNFIRHFYRQEISFGKKFHSDFNRQEISFGMALRNQNLTTGNKISGIEIKYGGKLGS